MTDLCTVRILLYFPNWHRHCNHVAQICVPWYHFFFYRKSQRSATQTGMYINIVQFSSNGVYQPAGASFLYIIPSQVVKSYKQQLWYPTHPPCNVVGKWGILESVCPYGTPTFVQKISSESLNHWATKLGMMVHHHDPECHAKRLGSYLQGQGQCLVRS